MVLAEGGRTLELRVLRYFLIVAREENITRAASLLHLTQPTLSRQLRQLEEELGVKLFQRSKYSIILTEEGMRLKQRAQELVSLADKVKAEFENHEEDLKGTITIGCGETKNMSFLSERMRTFREQYPGVQFQIYSATADTVKDQLEQGLLDIGLLTEPVDIAKYDFLRMDTKERWGILVTKGSPFWGRDSVCVDDLMGVPLLLPGRQSVQHELSSWFGEAFEHLEVAATFNLIINAANMVQHHVGIALCFELDFHYDDLAFVPLSPRLETGAVLAWKKNQLFSTLVSRFIECLRNAR